jgi:exodeoxyribonuclease-3
LPRDAGLRLDFLLLSASVKSRLREADVDRWLLGEPEASDHAPVWIELKD